MIKKIKYKHDMDKIKSHKKANVKVLYRLHYTTVLTIIVPLKLYTVYFILYQASVEWVLFSIQ